MEWCSVQNSGIATKGCWFDPWANSQFPGCDLLLQGMEGSINESRLATFHFLLWRQSGHADLCATWRWSDHSYLNLQHNSFSKLFWPLDYKALLADLLTCPTKPLQMIQNTTHTSLLFVSFHWQPISAQDTDNYTKKASIISISLFHLNFTFFSGLFRTNLVSLYWSTSHVNTSLG